MKRPWQVCLMFGACLAITLLAMGWLTLKALELDRAELAARRHAELEEKVSLALWRMDTLLAPLLAQEAARPHFVYRSFLNVAAGKADQSTLVPSPLLREPPQHVLLNFAWSPSDRWTSPQVPSKKQNELALQNNVSEQSIASNGDRLEQLSKDVDERELLRMLPTVDLPAVPPTEGLWASNVKLGENPTAVIDNTVGVTPYQTDDGSVPSASTDRAGQAEKSAAQSSRPKPPGEPDTTEDFAGSRTALPGLPPRPKMRPEKQPREGREWNRRNQFYQSYAQQAVAQQRGGRSPYSPEPLVREGISRPVWVKSHLLLARRVTVGDQVRVQGSWLDWPQIRQLLIAEVSELFETADVVPVADAKIAHNAGRMLATLPVELVVPTPDVAPSPFSPLRVSLWVAWACLIVATAAIVTLLVGVVALSERRASFVSAVTHELRTPLTTFRMYAEMLSEGMVPDQPTRQSYLETLRVEADRLSHLVENVLSYARLERGKTSRHRELVEVDQLIARVTGRLADRADQADRQLVLETREPVRRSTIRADVSAVEQILFNLVDNACKYAAAADDRRIHLRVTRTNGHVQFCVRDHGPGLSPDAAARLFRPFSKSSQDAAESAPGVGLGLALCRRLARQLGASLQWDSAYHDGARFVLTMPCAGERT